MAGSGKEFGFHATDEELARLLGYDPKVTIAQVAAYEAHQKAAKEEASRKDQIDEVAILYLEFMASKP